MTLGRRNPTKAARKERIDALRMRDGENCCHCHGPLDFSILDAERPDFVTLEHHPIPWRECRSHDLRFLKLSHRFCNELADFSHKNYSKRALSRFILGWHRRHREAMQGLQPKMALELAWSAHDAARAAA